MRFSFVILALTCIGGAIYFGEYSFQNSLSNFLCAICCGLCGYFAFSALGAGLKADMEKLDRALKAL